MFDFKGQYAVISGATRGIGRAVSEKFLATGAQVFGIYGGNEEAAQECLASNSQYGNALTLHRCNVADTEDVQKMFHILEERVNKEEGGIDILVNSAGIRRDAMLALMNNNDWQDVIDVNLTGTFLMSKGTVPLMMQKKYGRIINITSPVARLGFAGQSNYAASKAGQIAMTKSLAKEVARKKITVNCVSPGFIATDFIADLPEAQVSEYKKMVPMRRFGTAEEVADAVLFLASKQAAYISGSVLEISGGL